jgi:hypothetical protein
VSCRICGTREETRLLANRQFTGRWRKDPNFRVCPSIPLQTKFTICQPVCFGAESLMGLTTRLSFMSTDKYCLDCPGAPPLTGRQRVCPFSECQSSSRVLIFRFIYFHTQQVCYIFLVYAEVELRSTKVHKFSRNLGATSKF